MLIRFHLKLCARMSSKSFKCVSRMKLNNSLLSILKLLMIKRLSWKPEAPVWYSHGSCIDAEFGQSVLAVFYSTARLNTLKCNSRFWVNLWPSWQGAERRFRAWRWLLRRGVAKGWLGSACVRAGTRLTCPFPPDCSLSLGCCTVCNWPWFWVLWPPPLLHPELRHVTWRCSWSDWVTSGEEVYKVPCFACSYSSFTPPSRLFDMFGQSACVSDCVKGRLSPGSQLSVTRISYILTRCSIETTANALFSVAADTLRLFQLCVASSLLVVALMAG